MPDPAPEASGVQPSGGSVWRAQQPETAPRQSEGGPQQVAAQSQDSQGSSLQSGAGLPPRIEQELRLTNDSGVLFLGLAPEYIRLASGSEAGAGTPGAAGNASGAPGNTAGSED